MLNKDTKFRKCRADFTQFGQSHVSCDKSNFDAGLLRIRNGILPISRWVFSIDFLSSVAKSSAFKNSISIHRVVEITQTDWRTGRVCRRAEISIPAYLLFKLISIKNVTQELLEEFLAIKVTHTHADKT